MIGKKQYISYIERHTIDLSTCTFAQWNHFVMTTWREEWADQIPLTKENWEKAEQHILDSLSLYSYELLADNPNRII